MYIIWKLGGNIMKISHKSKLYPNFLFAFVFIFTIFSIYSHENAHGLESKDNNIDIELSGINSENNENFIVDEYGQLNDYTGSEKHIVIPNNVKIIGKYAFSGHSEIKSIAFPKHLERIGYYAFSNCTGLTVLDVPDSVTTIDPFAFLGCTGLKKIRLGVGVKSLGEMCFGFCDSLSSIEIDEDNQYFICKDGVLYDKKCETLMRCPQGKKGKFVVPSGVKKIDKYAFSDCRLIEEILFADNNLETIGEAAFFGCSSLKKINLPNNLKYIESGAFLGCEKLTDIRISSAVQYIGDSAFYECDALKEVEILSCSVKLGNHIFKGCRKDLVIKAPMESSVVEYAEKKNIKISLI